MDIPELDKSINPFLKESLNLFNQGRLLKADSALARKYQAIAAWKGKEVWKSDFDKLSPEDQNAVRVGGGKIISW